jgi:hypothetical protein
VNAAPPPGAGGDPRPPFGARWGALYALVIAALAADIALLAWLTVRFR